MERERMKDVLALTGMVMVECLIVGGNTLYKSATAQGINYYVFTFYVYLLGFLLILPFAFIFHRRTSIPPIQFSIVVKVFLLSLIVYLSLICGFIGVKYSSPTLSSIMGNLTPAFTFTIAFIFRIEKINCGSYSSQAKVIGTIVSISGAILATLYSGPLLLSNSINMNRMIGGTLLAASYILISFVFVAQAKILITYPVDLVIAFMFLLSIVLVAGVGGLVMTRDIEDWKLKHNIVLVTILFMGFCCGFSSSVQMWTLRLKGPIYVAMFKPISIPIAVIMGVLFLGDSLHLGSVVGGIIITTGFYGVLWGKAREETATQTTTTTPLL